VAEDRVEPRWLQVPKWDSATVSCQRSAAQNGQDSSLTKTMADLPSMVSGGSAAGTGCSGVAGWPAFTRLSTVSGTLVTCRIRLTGRGRLTGGRVWLPRNWAFGVVPRGQPRQNDDLRTLPRPRR
jgi:hypothetical protein